MTVRSMAQGERQQAFIGLSSDTKPVQNIYPGSLFYESDTGNVFLWKGDPSQGTTTDWALQTAGSRGSPSALVLAATTSNPGSDNTWKNTSGCTEFEARIAGTPVAGTGVIATEGVAVVWSPTYDDHSALGTILTAAVGETDATPTAPPVEMANCGLLFLMTDRLFVKFNGEERIKTIAARAIGATPAARNVAIHLKT